MTALALFAVMMSVVMTVFPLPYMVLQRKSDFYSAVRGNAGAQVSPKEAVESFKL